VSRSITIALLLTALSCADHPCKEECLRQLTGWQRHASQSGAAIPTATVCDDPTIVSSESCPECESILRAIADDNGADLTPVCDAVTEAS